ncbi:MAG: helix-turn-helix domain-containing protein [Desulfobacteraceae bacterium]|nr:helix-turn-helix domain-containing protein [Desulfobacteraceae bacterium]
MKRFEELNHYEILEIPVDASSFEIREAYRDALSIYNEDSLVTYSLFTNEERDRILKKVEKAFGTLIDEKSRVDYDRNLVKSGEADTSILNKKSQRKPIPLFRTRNLIDKDALFKKIRKRIEDKEVKEISNQILSKEVISGNDLKKLRESIGIELEEIFEVARIGVSILKSIEENRTEGLPSSVYLKNFLRVYAELLQVDSKKIVDGYLKNIQSFEAVT